MTDQAHIIVVGAGLSGLATALGAAVRGCSVTVLEASDMVGGAAAYSGGQVWVGSNHVEEREGIEDSLELAERYVRAIAHVRPDLLDEVAMRRWLTVAPVATKYWEDIEAIKWAIIPDLADYHGEAEGALGVGRYLTNEVFDGNHLGEWRDVLRVSPYFPVGLTYAEMYIKGRRLAIMEEDEDRIAEHAGVPAFGITDTYDLKTSSALKGSADPLTFGTGVVASFLARVLREDSITIKISHRAIELLQDDGGQVIGVRSEGPNGIVKDYGPVVLATSTYDWDPKLVEEMLGLDPADFGSVAPDSLRGDGINLARSVGGVTAHIPPNVVPILPGWRNQNGEGFGYGPEYAMPHCIIVDQQGKRYCNDSYWVDIVQKTLADGDRHLPFFLIWDDQHRLKYGIAQTAPGGQYPDGWAVSANTLGELAQSLGIEGDQLESTVSRFNGFAEQGIDPDFGRGSVDYVNRFAGDPNNKLSPVLGTLEQAPFHGLRLRFVGTGIGSSGVHIDGEGHALDVAGESIQGLYAVGSVAALTTTGTGYNSGFALGRGLTLAYLVAAEVAGSPIPDPVTL